MNENESAVQNVAHRASNPPAPPGAPTTSADAQADAKLAQNEAAPEGLVAAARRESVEALRAIKMGQYNDATSGLERARGTIGLLTGHVFQLIIALGEARLKAEELAGQLMEANLAAKAAKKPAKGGPK